MIFLLCEFVASLCSQVTYLASLPLALISLTSFSLLAALSISLVETIRFWMHVLISPLKEEDNLFQKFHFWDLMFQLLLAPMPCLVSAFDRNATTSTYWSISATVSESEYSFMVISGTAVIEFRHTLDTTQDPSRYPSKIIRCICHS